MAQACAADSGCPLTATGGMLAAYDELARRIEAGAVTGAGVGPTQLAYAAFWATYDAGHLAGAVARGRGGLDGDLGGIADLAGSFTGLVPYAPFALVIVPRRPAPRGLRRLAGVGGVAGRALAALRAVLANELLPCAFWPEGTYEPHAVDGGGDAADPRHREHRRRRHARTRPRCASPTTSTSGVLLTVEIDGHVAIGDSDCADAAVTRYLVDLAVPPPGTRC